MHGCHAYHTYMARYRPGLNRNKFTTDGGPSSFLSEQELYNTCGVPLSFCLCKNNFTAEGDLLSFLSINE